MIRAFPSSCNRHAPHPTGPGRRNVSHVSNAVGGNGPRWPPGPLPPVEKAVRSARTQNSAYDQWATGPRAAGAADSDSHLPDRGLRAGAVRERQLRSRHPGASPDERATSLFGPGGSPSATCVKRSPQRLADAVIRPAPPPPAPPASLSKRASAASARRDWSIGMGAWSSRLRATQLVAFLLDGVGIPRAVAVEHAGSRATVDNSSRIPVDRLADRPDEFLIAIRASTHGLVTRVVTEYLSAGERPRTPTAD